MGSRRILCALMFILSLNSLFALASPQADPSVATISPNARETFVSTMQWGDRCWDPQTRLLRDSPNGRPGVRESSWYALGLLLRNAPGDNERATSILNAVLAQQYNAPGMPFDGTFRRNLWEPNATGVGAVIWKDYDPNWREFIGTTFAIILEEFPDRLSKGLTEKLNESIVHAVAGEIANKRLVPTYTNPALMFGFLWNYAAVRNHRADWIADSTAWQETVYGLFKKYGTFNEYNSPTYCGVDLYALSLWRRYGNTRHTRALGSEMEAGLWRDLAQYYNANLKNISGPFDRAYGMDMQSYVSVLGLALRTVLDAQAAPLPMQAPPVEHGGDLWFIPQFAILGVHIPPDALESFQNFSGERLVRQQIDAQRVAEAWIGEKVMFGGESTGKTRDISGESQFHPATVQWRTPSGKIGWIQLFQAPPLNVTADRQGLTISCDGDVRLRIHAEGLTAADLQQDTWALPGLKVQIATDARRFVRDSGIGTTNEVEVEYYGITQMRLKIEAAVQ